MKALALIIALLASTASAQSNLPACSGSDVTKWNNCFGTQNITDDKPLAHTNLYLKAYDQDPFADFFAERGDKYVGEFRDGYYHGQGVLTFPNSKPPQEGIWEKGKFIRPQRIPDHIAGRTPLTPPAVALVATTASAQSNLPACSGSDVTKWNNCFGTQNIADGTHWRNLPGYNTDDNPFVERQRGDKYVGEFRDGYYQGQGVMTFRNVKPPQEGIWEKGKFIRPQRIPDHIAGRTTSTPQTVAPAPRQSELPRSSLNLAASSFASMATVILCDYLRSTWISDIEQQLALAEMQRRPNEGCSSNLNRAGVQNASPAQAAAPRQAEVTRSTLNPAISASSQETNGVEIPNTVPSKSRVFVFMDTIYGAIVSRYDIKFDGVELPQIYGYKYLQFDVQPGTYVINANRDGVGGTELHVTVGVNETQYVYVDPVGFPRPTPVLRLVNEVRGQKGINTSSPLQVPESGLAMFNKKGIVIASQEITQQPPNKVKAASVPFLRDDDKSKQANKTDLLRPQISVQTAPPRSLLNLAANASTPDSDGVVTINITTNSDTASLKINGDEVGGRADGRYSVPRFAQIGSNNFEIIATDRFGNTGKQTVVVNREIEFVPIETRSLNPTLIAAAKPRDAVAIIIGIEKYKSVPDADFANRDASAFYDYARRALGIKPENIRLLVDDKANSVEILRSFKTWLPSRVTENDTDVYVFYSGHGLPSEDGDSLYFLPHEVERDLLDRTAITQKEVVQAIQRASPKSVTMFIDSCYSGQSRTGTSLLASARPISIAAKAYTDFPPNFMVISASAPDQISSSSRELKHGIFSYYLMLGMEGEADVNKDGQITVGEMQTYLSQQVTRRASGMNRTQSPQTTGDLSRVLVQASSKTR